MPPRPGGSYALRPRKPEGSLRRTAAQEGHLDSHTASERYGLKQPGCFGGSALTRQNYETGCFNVLTRYSENGLFSVTRQN